jgi:hypothetical protein
VVAAPGADDFPGTVPREAPRVQSTQSFSAAEPGWHSTGLYLAPGEVLRVSPISGDPTQWRLRIGCHKDTLWQKDSWKRWPEITHVVDLEAGETTVATPWGGLVYLVPKANAGDVALALSGAVNAPRFDAAEPDAKESWASSRRAAGPWAELVGEHIVLTVPAKSVRDLNDPAAVTEYWDRLWTTHCALMGMVPPKRRERFVCDRQISAGYMHSGYPIMMHLDQGTARPAKNQPARLLDLTELRTTGNWGCFHELGHNLQRSAWTWRGSVEVTCNFFSLHGAEVMCGIEPWDHPWISRVKPAAADWLEQGATFEQWKQDPGKALIIFAQIQHEFGWTPFTAVFKQYESEPRSVWPKQDEHKIDLFCNRLSHATGHDLRPLFLKWSLPLSESVQQDASLSALPTWMPDFAQLRPAANEPEG